MGVQRFDGGAGERWEQRGWMIREEGASLESGGWIGDGDWWSGREVETWRVAVDVRVDREEFVELAGWGGL